MLLKIREATAGKFSYFIVAIISVPFALWGVSYYFQGGFDPVVIEVGSSEVTLSQFNANFTQRKRDLETELDITQLPPDDVIKNDIINALVTGEVLAQEADDNNYQVPDTQLARAITRIPDFMTDGKFDKERYENLLDTRRQSQIRFEENLRSQLRRNQLYEVIVRSSFVLAHEREANEKFLFQERRVRYIEFPMENYITPGSIGDDEAQKHYEDNLEQFVTSDEFQLDYIELSADDIAAGLTIGEDEVRAYYDDNPDLFSIPEQRTVAHILVDPERHDDDDAAEQRAYEIYDRLIKGEDFAKVAKTYSDDSLTAEDGGELPTLTREELDEDIGEIVFALDPQGFSEPMKSDFGWQIFKLLEVETSGEQEFETARETIEEQLRRERADDIYADSLAQLERLAFELPKDMEAIVLEIEALDEVKQTELLDIQETEGIFEYFSVKEALYTSQVINDRDNSEVVEVVPGRALVVRIAEDGYKPGRQQSFSEVESGIVAEILQTNAWAKTSEAVDEALKQLEEDKITFAALGKKNSSPVKDVGFIRRGGAKVPPMIGYTSFLMPETIGGHVRTKMQSVDSYAIIELVAVREGKVEAEEEDEQPQLSLGLEEFRAVFRGIIEKSSVKIHAERLEEEE